MASGPSDVTTAILAPDAARDRSKAPLRLALVVPCFNESEVLPTTIPALLALLDGMRNSAHCTDDSYIVFVDDGSMDATWALIETACTAHSRRVRGIRLSCNVGHQYALLAGLHHASGGCDAAISIDADLQDDLAALPRMVDAYRNGAEIVLGVKQARTPDSWAKRVTATAFYRLMRAMQVRLVENHADCRLMSAQALRNLERFDEYVLFLRGLQPLIHQRIALVHYAISPRTAGASKYTPAKMLALAWNGITSFSVAPLRMITWAGALVFVISLLFAINAVVQFARGGAVTGWASITVPLYLLGGLIMLSVGVVGEYVGKIFLEAKRRPRYLIDRIVGGDPQA